MIYLLKFLLLIVEIVACIFMTIFLIFCVFDEIAGAPATDKILSMMHFPIDYNQITTIGIISVIIVIVCIVLREKLS